MKAIRRLGLVIIGVFTTFSCVFAQSASSSKDVIPLEPENPANAPLEQKAVDTSHYRSSRGTPMPSYIDDLFREGRVREALAEFEKFKTTLKKTESFDLLFLEYTAYNQATMADGSNQSYLTKVNALKKDIIEKYPDRSDSYLIQITPDMTAEKKVELATKAIELDPTNEMAYRERGIALMMLEQTKEACNDLEKVSYKSKIPEYHQCKDLK
ncbi:MAG: hypothetical protein NC324_08290 [Bacteroides sp.]|nr:hypothetical protein [Bacteroides sp.]MCM1086373.1 hypothetical protein [Bacteroides sp.]MCM1169917.1 hypothetical protein [Bacteroides sp.]